MENTGIFPIFFLSESAYKIVLLLTPLLTASFITNCSYGESKLRRDTDIKTNTLQVATADRVFSS